MLLERELPLASLAEYAREAAHGEGRLVLVAGEAGVGKSALVEQLQRDVPQAHWSWGACDGLFTPRPLGPLFDLAAQLGGELRELCGARAAREELFDALLRFLGRRLRNSAVLLIATYRDDGLPASHPLRLALGELASQRSARRIGLAPLSAAAGVLASGLLVEDGTWLRFRHEIARLAVEQAIAAHRRGVIHARILAALRLQRCDDDARMAFHAEGAADGPGCCSMPPPRPGGRRNWRRTVRRVTGCARATRCARLS